MHVQDEIKLQYIIEGSNLGTWEWNVQTGEARFNARWAEIVGYTLEELAPIDINTWTRLAHPDDLKRSWRLLERHFAGELPYYEFETRMLHKQGHWVWVHDRGKVIEWTADGRPLWMFGTHTDVTQLIQDREQHAELQRFFDISPILMAIIDEQNHFWQINRSWQTVLGYTEATLAQIDWQDLLHPDDRLMLERRAENLIFEDLSTSMMVRLRHADGHYRIFEWFMQTHGKWLYATGRDVTERITDRKKLEQDLKMREKHLQLLQKRDITVNEFLDLALKDVIEFTGSEIGYIFLYDEETEAFNLHSWSDSVMAECQIKDQSRLYYLCKVGLWGEVVRKRQPIIINDYHSPHPQKNGYPAGHIEIRNFISIPVFQEGRIVAVVGAANKVSDYQKEDILNLRLLMKTVWSHVEQLKAQELILQGREDFLKFASQIPGMLYQFEITPSGNARVHFATDSIQEILGCTPEAVREDFALVLQAFHPDDRARVQVAISESAKQLVPFQIEFRVVLPGQPLRWILAKATPERKPDGTVLFHGFSTDITRTKQTEASLKSEHDLLTTTLMSMGEGIVLAKLSGAILLLNAAAEKISGFRLEDIVDHDFNEVFQIYDVNTGSRVAGFVSRLVQSGEQVSRSARFDLLRSDGEKVRLSANVALVQSADQDEMNVVISFRDISKEHELESQIEGFLNVNIDMLAIGDREGCLLRVNRKFEEVLGYRAAELVGQNVITFVHPDDLHITLEALSAVQMEDAAPGYVNRFRSKDGTYRYIEWNSTPAIGQFVYISARDITKTRLLEEQLREQANRDELTGLFNRHYLELIIDDSLHHADRYDEPLSILLLDIDHFKQVNDTYGHPVGDELLRSVARTIAGSVREADFVIRIGGEEFIVLLPRTDLQGALLVAEKIRQAIAANPLPAVGVRTASLGVAEHIRYESFLHWYRRVDGALYQAKQSGRNRSVASQGDEQLPLTGQGLEWHQDWECGNDEIDRQHQEMFLYGNRLLNLIYSASDQASIIRQLDILIDHIAKHFGAEIRLLKRIGYPNADHHASLHADLVAKVTHIKADYVAGKVKGSAFFSFMLDEVILGHMIEEDMLFFPYLKSGTLKG